MTRIPLANRSELLSSYETFIFDADGVLWLFGQPIPGAPEVLNSLIDLGKQVIILTNNPTLTIDEYVEKVNRLGFTRVKKENIVSSGLVTAYELTKRKRDDDLPVYVIGTNGLRKTLEQAGLEVFGIGPDHVDDRSGVFIGEVDTSRKVSTVVVSYDVHFNYIKLMKAVNYLKEPSVDFIVTEGDMIVPGPAPGITIPCTGWISQAVQTISNREPFVIGKPNRPVFDYIMSKFKIDPKRTLMTGDSTFTDIPFGNKHGFDTMLVLSGSHGLKDVEEALDKDEMDHVPTFYAKSIAILLENEGKKLEGEENLKNGA